MTEIWHDRKEIDGKEVLIEVSRTKDGIRVLRYTYLSMDSDVGVGVEVEVPFEGKLRINVG